MGFLMLAIQRTNMQLRGLLLTLDRVNAQGIELLLLYFSQTKANRLKNDLI